MQDALFLLLKLAIGGNTTPEIIPSTIDWQYIYLLSIRHGVSALCLDGIQKVSTLHSSSSFFASKVMKSGVDKLQWIISVMRTEEMYQRQENIIEKLSRFYSDEGIKMLLLKGYGLSLNYPNPNHRQCGDIDVYLYGKGEFADKRVEKVFGIQSKQNEDKHSIFLFDGSMVENHASIINTVIHPNSQLLEDYFERETANAISITIGFTSFYIPSANMNALFLPYHTAGHFCRDEANLRHLCDWATFVMKYGKSVDWRLVEEKAKVAGFYKFFTCLNGIVMEKLGVPADCLPKWKRNKVLEARILSEFIRKDTKVVNTKIDKIQKFWKNRWKYKIVYRENTLQHFLLLSRSYYRTIINKNAKSIWDKERQ